MHYAAGLESPSTRGVSAPAMADEVRALREMKAVPRAVEPRNALVDWVSAALAPVGVPCASAPSRLRNK